jgi:SAM-dependent methyltransferase
VRTLVHDQQTWLATALGDYLKTQEQVLFDSAIANIFGFNAVQLGMTDIDFLRACRMPFMIKAGASQGSVHCQSTQLPFQTTSIDLLLLPHVLEFSVDPHQTLRDAERVLVPEGHIIISGFNPLSAWGIKRLTAKSKGYPWQGTFFSLPRIKDWLSLLDFEIVSVKMDCYALPFSNPTWLSRFEFMNKTGSACWPMMGGVYLIMAKKRVLGMRVIRPEWKQNRLKSLVTAPTQRQPTQQHQEEHE